MRIPVDDAAAARRKQGDGGDGGDGDGDAAVGTPRGGWKSAKRNQLDAKKAAEAQRRRAEAAAAQLESDSWRKAVREAAERMADGGINPLWMRGQRRALQERARGEGELAAAAREARRRENLAHRAPSARTRSTDVVAAALAARLLLPRSPRCAGRA